MKKLIFLLFIFLFNNCSNKLYYEYIDNRTNTYALLEIHQRKREANYKEVSLDYENKYILIEGRKPLSKQYLGIDLLYSMIAVQPNLKVRTCIDLDASNDVLIYYKKDNKYILKSFRLFSIC